MKAMMRIALAAAFLSWFAAAPVSAISRDEVLVRAQTYCFHPWECKPGNVTASCAWGYQSVHSVGQHMGLPYDWGGCMTLLQFDKGLEQGQGAGSYPDDGILDCTVGLDCSGFVSKAWGVGHHTTSSMHEISHDISFSSVKEADAFNIPGYHVVVFGGKVPGNWPIFYEAIGYFTQLNAVGGWATVDGFGAIRLDSIQDWAAGSELGTAVEPIQVGQFPYVHNGDTSSSLSDMHDACAASIDKKETGPEVIYEVQIPSPGKLTVSVQDGPGVDIDVHLYSALDTYHCVARHDSLVEAENLACGTWYVMADSWCDSSGTEYPGPYTLTIEFQPYGGGCSSINEPYDFQGKAGDACAYSGNQNLPACNPNAGGQVCLYSDEPGNQFSFCSFMCGSDSDCEDDFPDGCCVDIVGAGEPQDNFCVTESFCDPTPPPPPVDEGNPPVQDVVSPQDTAPPPPPDVQPGPDTVQPFVDVQTPDLPQRHDSGPTPNWDAGATGETEPQQPVGADAATTADTGTGSPPSVPQDDASGDGGGGGGCSTTAPGGAPTASVFLLMALVALMRFRLKRSRGYGSHKPVGKCWQSLLLHLSRVQISSSSHSMS